MRREWHWLAMLAVLGLCGCSPRITSVGVLRMHPPLLGAPQPGAAVGIVQVRASDEVLDEAPEELLNITGLVVKAAKDSLRAAGIPLVDYSDLGYEVAWKRKALGSVTKVSLEALPPLPFGVQTPVVTVVDVLEWKVVEQAATNLPRYAARITLLMSTWTREGKPLRTEVIRAEAGLRSALQLHSTAASAATVNRFLGMRRIQSSTITVKEKLFWTALNEAVGLHFRDFLPHQTEDQVMLLHGAFTEPGIEHFRAGRYEEALLSWEKAFTAYPKASSAMYNAAVVYVLWGNHQAARDLLERARAVRDDPLFRVLQASLDQPQTPRWVKDEHERGSAELSTHLLPVAGVIQAQGAPPPEEEEEGEEAGVKAAAPESSCFLFSANPNRDLRWAQAGLSLDIDDQLLTEYHPQHCKRPGGGCYIEYYQLSTSASERRWSKRFIPGKDDIISPKTGVRQLKTLVELAINHNHPSARQWAAFATHSHRYRYCQY
jgi:tetratricopeptide (TPR) repeat protein